MSIEKFIEKLQEGDFTSATDVYKDLLKESSTTKIQERKQSILASSGFIVTEMKDEEDESDEEDDDDDKDEPKEKEKKEDDDKDKD